MNFMNFMLNPLESDIKLVTRHSWFACPLIDLQADSCTCVWNGGACTLTSITMLWGMWAGFICEHMLSRWNPPSCTVQIATLTSVLLLHSNRLFKMWCMFFFTVKTCLGALSERSTHSFSSISASPYQWRPLILSMPCLVRLSLISFLNGTTSSAISSRTLWTVFFG